MDGGTSRQTASINSSLHNRHPAYNLGSVVNFLQRRRATILQGTTENLHLGNRSRDSEHNGRHIVRRQVGDLYVQDKADVQRVD